MKRPSWLIWIPLLAWACSPVPSASPSAPPASADPSGRPSPSMAAQPTASAAPTLPTTGWREVFASDGSLRDIIAGTDGFMASGCLVGEGSDCERTIVAASPDGNAWTVTVVDPDADLFAPWLVVADSRFFALGYGHFGGGGGGGGAMVWTSTDGRSWTGIEAPSFRDRAVDDIIHSPVGTIAIGHEAPIDSDNTSGFLVWPVRADGSFGDVRSIDLGADQKLVAGVTWTGEEFLAWASPRWTTSETTVLGSPDGSRWTVRSTIARPAESYVAGILAVGDRLVAVGYSGTAFPLRPRAWVSGDDGRSWTVASVEGADAWISGVTVDGGRLVAIGVAPSLDGPAVGWGSIDGTAWSRLPDDEVVPAIAGFTHSLPVSHAGLTCVAGTFFDLPVPRGAIYCR